MQFLLIFYNFYRKIWSIQKKVVPLQANLDKSVVRWIKNHILLL